MSVMQARRVALAATSLALLGISSVAAPAAAASATCDYIGSNHKVKITLSGSGAFEVARGMGFSGRIYVNGTWCDNVATVTNTDRIVVLAGKGDQQLGIHLDNGGFYPGNTPEPGDTDEIEISASLGGGTDSLTIWGSNWIDHVRVGKSSGFAVMGAMNLNADEQVGIDADLTMILGIETVRLIGHTGPDTISAAGGAGTGDPASFSLFINGQDGEDAVTGGAMADTVIGGNDADVIKGGAGADYLNASDGAGTDEVYGGDGADTCVTDSGDFKKSC